MPKKLSLSLLWILFFFPLRFLEAKGQEQNEEIREKNPKKKEKKKELEINYRYGIFLGADLYGPIFGLFNKDKKLVEFLAYGRIYKKFHLAMEIGHGNLIFDKLDWNAHTKGMYYKFGFHFSLSQFDKNPDEMFYIGFRYSFSPYHQEIKKYPLRGFKESKNKKKYAEGEGFPGINLKSHWIEPLFGARLAVFRTGFYLDASLQLKFLITTTKQNNISPLIIPGFGENRDYKNLSIKWALTYKIPIGKNLK